MAGWSIAAASAANAAVAVGGAFELSRPSGKVVTDRDFRGKWLLVYFGYTSCPDSCPTALAEIAKTLVELGADADRVQSPSTPIAIPAQSWATMCYRSTHAFSA